MASGKRSSRGATCNGVADKVPTRRTRQRADPRGSWAHEPAPGCRGATTTRVAWNVGQVISYDVARHSGSLRFPGSSYRVQPQSRPFGESVAVVLLLRGDAGARWGAMGRGQVRLPTLDVSAPPPAEGSRRAMRIPRWPCAAAGLRAGSDYRAQEERGTRRAAHQAADPRRERLSRIA